MNLTTLFKTLLGIIILNLSSNVMAQAIDNLDNQRVKWIPFSDQVMGGVSEVNFLEKEEDGLSFYHMEGNVSTENNGGFIQIRHNLIKPLEETTKGIRLKVRGNGENYYILNI